MRFSTVATALVAPLLVSAVPMKIKRASETDILVLRFAEVLERLETQFYQEAIDKFVEQDFIDAGFPLADVAIQNFQSILEHESAHTDFLGAALAAVGSEPVPNCSFNFGEVLSDVATMAAVARVVEAVGVGAYLGGSVLIEDPNILSAAASILTIEARHQTLLNTLNGATAVPQGFDIAFTPQQVLAIAGGFISGCEELGITPNDVLTVTNEGPIAPGTLLTFDFPRAAELDPNTLSCQMLIGGVTDAISLPLAECIVPDGINGPVALFITDNDQPLASNVVIQNGESVVAGPTLAFLDTVPDVLGSLAREGGGPVEFEEDITPDQAQELIDNGSIVDGELEAPEQVTDPALAPAPETPETPETPVVEAPVVETPENANTAPPTGGATPPIRVIGLSEVPL